MAGPPPPGPTLFGGVAWQAQQRPGAIAVVDGHVRLDFEQLEARSNQVARALIECGVAPCSRQPIGACVEGHHGVVALLAIMKTGNPYVPLDPDYPATRLQFMLDDSGAATLVTTSRLYQRSAFAALRFAGTVFEVDGKAAETVARQPADPLDLPVNGDTPAYVLYTSGSSGFPKGVVGQHSAMVNRFQWMWEAFPFDAEDVCCQKTSYNFLDSMFETFGCLAAGCPLVLLPPAARTDVRLLVDLLAKHRVTRLIVVPSLLRLITLEAEAPGARLAGLRYCTSSGEALTWELAAAFLAAVPQCTLLNLYGSTEVAADVTCFAVPANPCPPNMGLVPLGQPISHTGVHILDPETLRPLPPDTPGELFITGWGLAEGYWRRPELTRDAFVLLPGDAVGDPGGAAVRAYRSGDLGYCDVDGVLHYVGRRDQQVKVHGQRIDLLEVEAQIAACPGVTGACVVVRDEGRRLFAFATPVEVDGAAILQHLRSVLPAAVVPCQVVPLPTLPQLPSGKVDRPLLRTMASTMAVRSTPAAVFSCRAPPLATASMLVRLLRPVLDHLGDPLSDATEAGGGQEVVGAAIETHVPLARLGLDSMDGMIFKQAVLRELQRKHPDIAFPASALNLDFASFEWLTLDDVARQVDSLVMESREEDDGAGERAVILERDRRTPLAELREGGITAAARGDLAAVEAWLAGGRWAAEHAVDRRGSTALHWAAGNGHLAVCQALVAANVPVAAGNKLGRTALMLAAKGGHLPVVRWLVEEAGADPMQTERDGSGTFAWAVMGGDLGTIGYLATLPGVDIHATNRFGCTAANWSAAAGNVEVCRWLLAAGLDFGHRNAAGHGVVDAAAWKGHRPVLEWLLLAPDGPRLLAQLTLPDAKGLTVAQSTRLAGHHAVADWLEGLRPA
eukprot:EG_transcript_2372